MSTTQHPYHRSRQEPPSLPSNSSTIQSQNFPRPLRCLLKYVSSPLPSAFSDRTSSFNISNLTISLKSLTVVRLWLYFAPCLEVHLNCALLPPPLCCEHNARLLGVLFFTHEWACPLDPEHLCLLVPRRTRSAKDTELSFYLCCPNTSH